LWDAAVYFTTVTIKLKKINTVNTYHDNIIELQACDSMREHEILKVQPKLMPEFL